jgi:hypothetical protein
MTEVVLVGKGNDVTQFGEGHARGALSRRGV